MFDWKKPTVQMLGRWQPWHDGHQELFKRSIKKTGQVIIQVRDVHGASGGEGQDDNPFDWDSVCQNISEGLLKDTEEETKKETEMNLSHSKSNSIFDVLKVKPASHQ